MEQKNYTDKPITEFNESDTLYVVKRYGGYDYTFLIKFKSFSKGMVVGEILEIQPNDLKRIWFNDKFYTFGSEISSRISKCFTFGSKNGCYWFKKVVDVWKCA